MNDPFPGIAALGFALATYADDGATWKCGVLTGAGIAMIWSFGYRVLIQKTNARKDS